MTVELIEKLGFVRVFEVSDSEGRFEVTYDGEGMGYEQVLVNGEVIAKKRTVLWYAPEFRFNIGAKHAVMYIRV